MSRLSALQTLRSRLGPWRCRTLLVEWSLSFPTFSFALGSRATWAEATWGGRCWRSSRWDCYHIPVAPSCTKISKTSTGIKVGGIDLIEIIIIKPVILGTVDRFGLIIRPRRVVLGIEVNPVILPVILKGVLIIQGVGLVRDLVIHKCCIHSGSFAIDSSGPYRQSSEMIHQSDGCDSPAQKDPKRKNIAASTFMMSKLVPHWDCTIWRYSGVKADLRSMSHPLTLTGSLMSYFSISLSCSRCSEV